MPLSFGEFALVADGDESSATDAVRLLAKAFPTVGDIKRGRARAPAEVRWRAIVAHPRWSAIVTHDAACVFALVDVGAMRQRVLYCPAFAVREESRRKGVGTRMFYQIEKVARSRSINAEFVVVSAAPTAQGFWTKLGFVHNPSFTSQIEPGGDLLFTQGTGAATTNLALYLNWHREVCEAFCEPPPAWW